MALHSLLNFSLVPGMKGTTRVMFLLVGVVDLVHVVVGVVVDLVVVYEPMVPLV